MIGGGGETSETDGESLGDETKAEVKLVSGLSGRSDLVSMGQVGGVMAPSSSFPMLA